MVALNTWTEFFNLSNFKVFGLYLPEFLELKSNTFKNAKVEKHCSRAMTRVTFDFKMVAQFL